VLAANRISFKRAHLSVVTAGPSLATCRVDRRKARRKRQPCIKQKSGCVPSQYSTRHISRLRSDRFHWVKIR
jgi:hypothetical protein